MNDELLNLKNLGKTSTQWLHAVGIHSATDLRRLGSVGAYRAVTRAASEPRKSCSMPSKAHSSTFTGTSCPQTTRPHCSASWRLSPCETKS